MVGNKTTFVVALKGTLGWIKVNGKGNLYENAGDGVKVPSPGLVDWSGGGFGRE